jgi:signal transduction histidine kinase
LFSESRIVLRKAVCPLTKIETTLNVMNRLKEPGPKNPDINLSRRIFANIGARTAAAGGLPHEDISDAMIPAAVVGRLEESAGLCLAQWRGRCTGRDGMAQTLRLAPLAVQSRESAIAAERSRMARDIHDTLAHGFTGVMLQLEAAEDALSRNLAGMASKHVGRAREIARDGLREARRSVGALRSEPIERRNLCEAMNGMMKKMTDGTALRAQFVSSGRRRELPMVCEENLLHIGREALTNTVRHARATEFEARLAFDAKTVRLDLRDNGCGHDPAASNDGFGLLGMRERVESIGGRLLIRSARGLGTSIFVVLRIASAWESTLRT